MTKDQVNSLIGDNFGKWISLNCSNILLSNDGHIYPAKDEIQFCFDSVYNLMFVRHTFPYIIDRNNGDTELVQREDGKTYLRLLAGGANDSKVGRYHEVFTFDTLTSFS